MLIASVLFVVCPMCHVRLSAADILETPRDGPALLNILDGVTGGDPSSDLPLSMLQTMAK